MTDSQNDAKRYSYKLLGYRGRSEKELREKLGRKGFTEEVISRTIEGLKHAGYLDDSALARDLKRLAFERKLLGYEAARSFMMKRGLSGDIVSSELEYDESREVLNARKLLDKKLRSMGNYLTEAGRRRLWNFLARRGYSSGIIKKVLADLDIYEEN